MLLNCIKIISPLTSPLFCFLFCPSILLFLTIPCGRLRGHMLSPLPSQRALQPDNPAARCCPPRGHWHFKRKRWGLCKIEEGNERNLAVAVNEGVYDGFSECMHEWKILFTCCREKIFCCWAKVVQGVSCFLHVLLLQTHGWLFLVLEDDWNTIQFARLQLHLHLWEEGNTKKEKKSFGMSVCIKNSNILLQDFLMILLFICQNKHK